MADLKQATKILDQVKALSQKYWSGSPGKQNTEDREILYTRLAQNLELWGVVLDIDESHLTMNDKAVIEFETAAIWGWSGLRQDGKQVNANSGFTYYKEFVERLYARPRVEGMNETAADFKKTACEATNNDNVYKNLRIDDKLQAREFMDMALTVTTTLYSRESHEGVAAAKLWEERLAALVR